MPIKPLLEKDLNSFLKRFDSFKDAELRSIEIISPNAIKITLSAQDSAREFDWITVELEFSGVADTQLPQESKISHIDMGDGITIIYANNSFIFGIGRYENQSSIKNSICFITSSSIKYAESSF